MLIIVLGAGCDTTTPSTPIDQVDESTDPVVEQVTQPQQEETRVPNNTAPAATEVADDATQNTTSETVTASLSTVNQKILDETIVVDRIQTSVDAWAVIYKNENEIATKMLGYKHVPAGSHEYVRITFSQNMTTLEELNTLTGATIMLHKDAGVAGSFEPNVSDTRLDVAGSTFSIIQKATTPTTPQPQEESKADNVDTTDMTEDEMWAEVERLLQEAEANGEL